MILGAGAWHSMCTRGESRGPRGLGEWVSSPSSHGNVLMPSMAHEILVDLFKSRPLLAAEILVESLGFALPAYDEARLASVDLTEIQPAEYRARTSSSCCSTMASPSA